MLSLSDFEHVTEAWKQIQNGSAICDPFQTIEWAEVTSKSMNLTYKLLIAKGEVGGVVLTERNFLIPQLKYVEIRGGPLCIPGCENEIIRDLIRYMNERKDFLFKVIQPSPLLSSKFALSGLKETYPRTYTFLLDLGPSESDLWNNLDKKARWGVRKAERVGVKVEEATSFTQWETYYHLHNKHCMRHNLAPMPWSFFQSVFNVLYPKKMAVLFLANFNDRVIAGSLFLIHRWYMVYFQNASIPKFLSYQPNNLIQWKSIVWAHNNGIKVYDLGGVPDPTLGDPFLRGVYKFKKRWGGHLSNYDYYAIGKIYQIGTYFFYNSETARKLFWAFRNVRAM